MDIEQFTIPVFALSLTLKLFLVYTIARNIEFLSLVKQFSRNGILSWEISRLRSRNRVTIIFSRPAIFYTNTGIILFLIISTICSLLLITNMAVMSSWILFLPVFICNFMIHFRNTLFCDGSDTMSNILGICLLIGLCNKGSEMIIIVSLAFIAVQSTLSYLFSGVSKLRSEIWMKENALYRILNTSVFGNAYAAKATGKLNRRWSRLVNVSMVAWQCLFPLALMLPLTFFFIYLGSSLLFHLANVFMMGLARFMLVFIATYPSLIFIKLKYLNY